MNILQVTPHFFMSWAGNKPAELFFELSKALVKNNQDVTIFTTDIFNRRSTQNNKKKNVTINGVSIYEFKSIGWYPFFISIDLMKALSKEIKKFDIIHVHEHRTFQSIIVHHYARKHKIPYVVHVHGGLPTNIGKPFFKKMYDYCFGERFLKNAAKLIAITETESKQYELIGIPREKIEIIPNGVDFSEYHNLPYRGAFRDKIGISPEEKIILYLGRLDSTKGIDLLIKSFAELSSEICNLKLIIIGKDVGFETHLRNLVKELNMSQKVVFTGFLQKNEKIEAFVDADVFVTPSFYGFPHTFLESCACGTPIITTKKGDKLDWIDGKVGFVVKFEQNELKKGISKILLDEPLRNKFSHECRKVVHDKFDWPVIIVQLEKLYSSVIQKKDENLKCIPNEY